MRLYGRVLSRMKVENKVIWITLEKSDFNALGLLPQTYTGLSSYLIQADEAYISATFTEIEPNVVECGFRAVPGFDVSQVALQLGGGGHVLASGCTVRGKSLAEVEAEVVAMLKQVAKNSKPLYK
jgi:bifunctional oligoribonuclease and PAP phosphatase NrnA